MLETIQSRSEIIHIAHEKSETQDFTLPEHLQELLVTFPASHLPLAEVFQLSEKYKDRGEAMKLLQAVIVFLHGKLCLHPTPKLLEFLKSALVAIQHLEKNVNTRLVTEEYFFQFVAEKKKE